MPLLVDVTAAPRVAFCYPRLRGRLGAVCTEAFAREHGALIFNHSDPSPEASRQE